MSWMRKSCRPPVLRFLTKLLDADGGIVISASHNPVQDNGIKFFGKAGKNLRMTRKKQLKILYLENNRKKYPLTPWHTILRISKTAAIYRQVQRSVIISITACMGRMTWCVGRNTVLENAYELYTSYLSNFFNLDLSPVKIAIDCANGAAGRLAPMVFKRFGAKVISFNTDFGGENINRGAAQRILNLFPVRLFQCGAQLGFAYDGDCDRVIACDSRGKIIDGDLMLGFAAMDMAAKGTLKNNSVVTTVMANMGFDKAMAEKALLSIKRMWVTGMCLKKCWKLTVSLAESNPAI